MLIEQLQNSQLNPKLFVQNQNHKTTRFEVSPHCISSLNRRMRLSLYVR